MFYKFSFFPTKINNFDLYNLKFFNNNTYKFLILKNDF
jgi:hypothetical protein